MRTLMVFCWVMASSICFAQTDSMFVEKMDGTIRGYPITLINQISFSGTPTSVKEKELVQNVLSSFHFIRIIQIHSIRVQRYNIAYLMQVMLKQKYLTYRVGSFVPFQRVIKQLVLIHLFGILAGTLELL